MTHNTKRRWHALAVISVLPFALIMAFGWFITKQAPPNGGEANFDREAVYAALENVHPRPGLGPSTHPGDIDDAITRLEAKLKTQPDSAEEWRVLGWSYFKKQEFRKAASAYQTAVKMDPGDPILRSLYAEALVAADGGRVSPQARNIFSSVLAADSDNARARYFTGQAYLQDGDSKSALKAWRDLLEIAPKGAQWAADLRSRISEVSRQTGISDTQNPAIDAMTALVKDDTEGSAGPTQGDIANAQSLRPKVRLAMARDMVARLASRLKTSPDDPEGWIMLIRSRVVLNEVSEAKMALKTAVATFAKNPHAQARILNAAHAFKLSPGD